MNLLVTNTRNAQAYAIIRALRPHVAKIVASMEGDNRLAARLSHAANSRLVNNVTTLPRQQRTRQQVPKPDRQVETHQ